jgi:hypothetical protein
MIEGLAHAGCDPISDVGFDACGENTRGHQTH